MVAALRNTVAGGKALPYDAAIAYIAGNSSHTAYIETPYVPQTNDIVLAKLYWAGGDGCWLFNTEDHFYGNTHEIGDGTAFGIGWAEPRFNFGRGFKSSSIQWEIGLNDIRIEGQILYVNNSVAASMAGASLSGTTWLPLLGNHRGSSVIECATPKYGVGAFAVIRNGVKIHDYISGPLSSGILLNAGTGSFTLGNDL